MESESPQNQQPEKVPSPSKTKDDFPLEIRDQVHVASYGGAVTIQNKSFQSIIYALISKVNGTHENTLRKIESLCERSGTISRTNASTVVSIAQNYPTAFDSMEEEQRKKILWHLENAVELSEYAEIASAAWRAEQGRGNIQFVSIGRKK